MRVAGRVDSEVVDICELEVAFGGAESVTLKPGLHLGKNITNVVEVTTPLTAVLDFLDAASSHGQGTFHGSSGVG